MGKGGLQPRCRTCLHEQQKKRRQSTWDNARLKYVYGLTVDDILNKLKEQDNKCAICETTFENRTNTVVDHCHHTGKFRGLLCRTCNVGIGQLRDDPDIVLKAYKYLCLS
jgi:hypothetical protein